MMPAASVQCCVTSPPYWGLRDYGHPGQLGHETTVQGYVAAIADVCDQIKRVLRPDGTFWLNIGDSYSAKQCVGVPWRVAFELQDRGWLLRCPIVWAKTCPIPESVKDRPTRSYEFVFLFTKGSRYYYDLAAIRETAVRAASGAKTRKIPGYTAPLKQRLNTHSGIPWKNDGCGRNARDVWTITPRPYPGAHCAVMPEALADRCVAAGTSAGGACAQCGAPLERVEERLPAPKVWLDACGADAKGVYNGKATKDFGEARAQDASATKARILAGLAARRTVGWKPTCSCGMPATAPCVVLDPWAGTGTTGVVCARRGLRFIGAEINGYTVGEAEARLGLDSEPF